MTKKNLRPLLEIISVVILALPLAMVAWIGFYTRYVSDDFLTAGYLRTLGFWGSQYYWYITLSGRYAFTFLVNLIELLGPGAAIWLPVTSLALWTVALYWLFDGLFKLVGLPYSRLVRLGAALLVLYTTLRTLADWQQVILWQTGVLTYTLPLIGLTFWSAWFLARINKSEPYRPRWHTLLLTVVLFWILGGLSETSLAFQTTLLGLALVLFCLLPAGYMHRRGTSLLLIAGLAGSLVAFFCVLAAPGNSLRLGHPEGIRIPSLIELIYPTTNFARHYLKDLFANSLRPVACLLGIPALIAFGFHPQSKQKTTSRDLIWLTGFLLLFFLAIMLVYWICFTPAYVAMRAGPPHRSMVVMFFWLSLTFGIESYVLGLTLSRTAQWISPFFQRAHVLKAIRVGVVLVTFVLLMLGPLQAAQKLWRIWPEYRQFATAWDARDRLARQDAAKGINNATLPQLDDLYDLGPDTSRQFAVYYGLPGTITFYSTNP